MRETDKKITFWVDKKLSDAFDEWIKKSFYKNKSDYFREIMRKEVTNEIKR